MGALLLLIFIYAVLGFMYAWITGVVAREEIEVKTGIFIVVLPLVARIALFVAVQAMEEPPSGLLVGLAAVALDFGMLVLGGRFIARVEWKPAVVIAIVYTVLLFVVLQGLALLAG